MKTAVVDVGGGMRGVYASGVLDRCLKENIQFDLCIGVSRRKRESCILSVRSDGAQPVLLPRLRISEGIHELAQFFPHPFLRRFGIHLRYLAEQSGREKMRSTIPASCTIRHSFGWWQRKRCPASQDISPRRTSGRMTTASSWHPPVCRGSIVRFCSTVCCTTTVRWQTRSPSKRRLTLSDRRPAAHQLQRYSPVPPARPADCPHDRTGISRLCPSAAHPRRALQRLCCPRQTVSAGGSTADCRTL